MSEMVEGKIRVKAVRYYKNNWGIVSAEVTEDPGHVFHTDYCGRATFKGTMPDPVVDREYEIVAKEVEDPKWGLQYDIVNMCVQRYVDEDDAEAKRKYLECLFTTNQIEAMYEALDDPFEALKNRDTQSLVKVRGCGFKNAAVWCERFANEYYLSRLFTELADYDLSPALMRRLISAYESPDIIIQQVKANPYVLVEVSGIGFKTADVIAMKGGIEEFSTLRVSAFIKYILRQAGESGKSWIYCDELMNELVLYFGENIPDLCIADSIHEVEDELWWNDDKTQIGLAYYRNLEKRIADELWRLKEADKPLWVEDWTSQIQKIEQTQGWGFTDQQMAALQAIIMNNVVVVNGAAGCGKTSIAKAIVEIYRDYISVACCLSGKASMRIGEVMGTSGSTIHRLLGIDPDGGFIHNSENQLPVNLIIVDEISMIGGTLWKDLLQAIRSGTKLILLGDTGQLTPIGSCNVADDIILSHTIPVVTLDKIHRQAQKSAIITESMKARKGIQLISKDWAGVEVRGELQDFVLDCYSDVANTYHRVLEYYDEAFEELQDHNKIQILSPVKQRGAACTWNLNTAIQEKYNPASDEKRELSVKMGRTNAYILREGDKVINTVNRYKARKVNGAICPVFNGNIGTVVEADPDNRYLLIDFVGLGTIMIDSDFSGIQLGYAVTIHKFQGSSAEICIFALDYGAYSLLSREMVYTGITRAEKKCILVAQNAALRYSVGQAEIAQKQTHLKNILNDLANPPERVLNF